MNELKQAMAEVINKVGRATDNGYGYYIKNIEDIAAAILDMPEFCALSHDIEAYRGALGYSVQGRHNGLLYNGQRPVCGLCEAHALQNTASLNGGIRQPEKTVVSFDIAPASGMGLPNSSDGGVTMEGVIGEAVCQASLMNKGDNLAPSTTYTHEQVQEMAALLSGARVNYIALGMADGSKLIKRLDKALAPFTEKGV